MGKLFIERRPGAESNLDRRALKGQGNVIPTILIGNSCSRPCHRAPRPLQGKTGDIVVYPRAALEDELALG